LGFEVEIGSKLGFGQGSPKVRGTRMGDLDLLDFMKLVHDKTFFEAFTPDVMVDVMVLPRPLFRKLTQGHPTRMGDLDVLDLIKKPFMTYHFSNFLVQHFSKRHGFCLAFFIQKVDAGSPKLWVTGWVSLTF
jgi:hypothetical protein